MDRQIRRSTAVYSTGRWRITSALRRRGGFYNSTIIIYYTCRRSQCVQEMFATFSMSVLWMGGVEWSETSLHGLHGVVAKGVPK
jgi:hypothetical protein